MVSPWPATTAGPPLSHIRVAMDTHGPSRSALPVLMDPENFRGLDQGKDIDVFGGKAETGGFDVRLRAFPVRMLLAGSVNRTRRMTPRFASER